MANMKETDKAAGNKILRKLEAKIFLFSKGTSRAKKETQDEKVPAKAIPYSLKLPTSDMQSTALDIKLNKLDMTGIKSFPLAWKKDVKTLESDTAGSPTEYIARTVDVLKED